MHFRKCFKMRVLYFYSNMTKNSQYQKIHIAFDLLINSGLQEIRRKAEKQKAKSSLFCFVASAGGCRNNLPHTNRSCLNVAEMVLHRFRGKVQLQAVWETSHL